MVDYLNDDGRVYIEGCDFAANNDTTALYQMFGGTFAGDGNDMATGNISTASGMAGTITDGMAFGYLYHEWPDNYVDYITPGAGTVIFRCQTGCNRAIIYSGPSGSYRAIHSCFIFGALRDGASTKAGLMDAYLQYLFSNTAD